MKSLEVTYSTGQSDVSLQSKETILPLYPQKFVGDSGIMLEDQGVLDSLPTDHQLMEDKELSLSALTASLGYNDKDDNHNYGTFVDPVQRLKCVELVQRLREQIQSAQSKFGCRLFVPHNLIQRISCDVIRMSECEPCGLRGCVLHISLERPNKKHELGSVVLDPETNTTFEVYLTLKQDNKKWTFQIKNLMKPVFGCLLDKIVDDDVFISPGFQLIKNKLYRANHS